MWHKKRPIDSAIEYYIYITTQYWKTNFKLCLTVLIQEALISAQIFFSFSDSIETYKTRWQNQVEHNKDKPFWIELLIWTCGTNSIKVVYLGKISLNEQETYWSKIRLYRFVTSQNCLSATGLTTDVAHKDSYGTSMKEKRLKNKSSHIDILTSDLFLRLQNKTLYNWPRRGFIKHIYNCNYKKRNFILIE